MTATLQPPAAKNNRVSRNRVKDLQVIACQAARDVNSDCEAARVVVLCRDGKKIIDITIPRDCAESFEALAAIGWHVTDRLAQYDGEAVPIAPSRLKLLRTLIEAEGSLKCKDLIRMCFDRVTDEDNVRYHVSRLRKELKEAFPEHPEPITSDQNGYYLALR